MSTISLRGIDDICVGCLYMAIVSTQEAALKDLTKNGRLSVEHVKSTLFGETFSLMVEFLEAGMGEEAKVAIREAIALAEDKEARDQFFEELPGIPHGAAVRDKLRAFAKSRADVIKLISEGAFREAKRV